MRVIDIENITFNMRNELQFVFRCEEVFRDKIAAAAVSILSERDKKPFVCLTGPSGSGKTSTALRLKDYLNNLGVPVLLVSMDNFFVDMDKRVPEARTDWESPLCVDIPALVDCLEQLSRGQTVQMPWYDFCSGNRGGTRAVQGDRDAIIIAEGIHMLNPLIFDRIRDRSTGIYVAPRTRVITHDDRIVKPEQIRVARRLIRDFNTRGRDLRQTVEKAQSVDRGEREYITPFKTNAEIHIDSFHDYELCILARYLREIPQFSQELTPEYMESHGLSALYDVVQSVPPLTTDYVPRDSILREFVGGSIYTY